MQSKERLQFWGAVTWGTLKYHLLTRLFLAVVLLPLFQGISTWLIQSTGRLTISSGDYLGFLFSLQGLGVLLAALFVLALLTGIDIHAFVMMSALAQEKSLDWTARELLLAGLTSFRLLLKRPIGFLVLLYNALIVPLVGIGLSVSLTREFKIPNFITDVIFSTPLYLAFYSLLMLFLSVLAILFLFFFHFLILEQADVSSALRQSANLVRKRWKSLLKDFFLKGLLVLLAIIVLLALNVLILTVAQGLESAFWKRLASFFVALCSAQVIALFSILTPPFLCFQLTRLFYRFRSEEKGAAFQANLIRPSLGGRLTRSFSRPRSKRVVLSLVAIFFLLGNIAVSGFLSLTFDELFQVNENLLIVAHRGGGDLAAENSLLGLKRAIEEGASWSEIDVQRTKDGHYVIHHDSSFSRLTGEKRRAQEMTLAEIKQLRLKDHFDSSRAPQAVATLEEMLDLAKGKIGLFIELKGKTADERMVEDVVTMVKARGMEKEVVILSLDYPLIRYLEANHPELESGFLYFFAFGQQEALEGDWLVMEEREATPAKVEALQAAGKKVVVWTVNSEESIKRFVDSEVDGLITDSVPSVKAGIQRRDERSELDLIFERLIQ